MISNPPKGGKAKATGEESRWRHWGVLGVVCALVIGFYASVARSGALESFTLNPADTYYNLLVQGFRAGQLSLKKEPPPELARLPDPYDPVANAPYRPGSNTMHDLSYYKGRLYLYFGATPALILFWPYTALTGHYLFHRQAVAIFFALGFLASAGLLYALWRRYFPEVRLWVVAAGLLALGLATGMPVLLPQCDVYEVPISCGYLLTMLALGALWCALHETEPRRTSGWLAAASLAYGLAVGARPNLLFGAVFLLVPVVQAWREPRKRLGLLGAALGPITLIGLGLMLYNYLRFENPLEFGLRYELGPSPMQLDKLRFFNLEYLWFNLRVYFLEPAQWGSHFPFVHRIIVPPLPLGRGQVETPYGVLTNIPLVCFAPLGVWLAMADRSSTEERAPWRWFVAAVALVLGINAFVLCLFRGANFRYEMEFLPALVLLAAVGILAMERARARDVRSGPAGRMVWWRAARWGWCLLLVFSVAFNLLAGVEHYARADCYMGNVLWQAGKRQEAMRCYERALRIMPEFVEAYCYRGDALLETGKIQEAMRCYEQALQIKPDDIAAHNNLGLALEQAGRTPEAIRHYEAALRIDPNFAEGHYDLGLALQRLGRVPEAIGQYEQAVRLKPVFAEAHNSLGVALQQAGKNQEAIEHFEQAVRAKPDYAEAHFDLGFVLEQVGRVQEAIAHYEQALRLKPDFAEGHRNLGDALQRLGRVQEAIGHYEETLRIRPDSAEAHNSLGVALQQAGRIQEAIGHFEQALRINPGYADAHYNLGLALEQLGRVSEALQHYEQVLRIRPDDAEAQNRLARLRPVR